LIISRNSFIIPLIMKRRESLGCLVPAGMVAIIVGGALLVGISNEIDNGDNDSFEIKGTIEAVGNHSVSLGRISVKHADGKATHWFEDGRIHQVHDGYDHCRFGSSFPSRKDVGSEFNAEDQEMSIGQFSIGEEVEVDGSIRESVTHCSKGNVLTSTSRPVYTRLQELTG
jgi:hypothetical protein